MELDNIPEKSPEELEYIEALNEWALTVNRIVQRNKDSIAEIEEVMTKTTNLFKRGASPDSVGKSKFKYN